MIRRPWNVTTQKIACAGCGLLNSFNGKTCKNFRQIQILNKHYCSFDVSDAKMNLIFELRVIENAYPDVFIAKFATMEKLVKSTSNFEFQ